MSAEPMIRELFRGLEVTLHERLSLIEQVLTTIEKPKVALYDNEFVKRIERLEQQQRVTPSSSAQLEMRVNALETQHGSRYMEERMTALEEQLAAACAELEDLRNKPSAAAVAYTVPATSVSLPEDDVECEVLEDDVEEVEEAEELEEAEEAEGEDGMDLEEFQHKGTTYYRDAENNVYMTDEEGAVISEPVARWNGLTGAGSKLLRIA